MSFPEFWHIDPGAEASRLALRRLQQMPKTLAAGDVIEITTTKGLTLTGRIVAVDQSDEDAATGAFRLLVAPPDDAPGPVS